MKLPGTLPGISSVSLTPSQSSRCSAAWLCLCGTRLGGPDGCPENGPTLWGHPVSLERGGGGRVESPWPFEAYLTRGCKATVHLVFAHIGMLSTEDATKCFH